MIQGTTIAVQAGGWQAELAGAVRDPAQLLQMLDLPARLLPAARRAAADFGLRAPHAYVARMQPRDPHDPLLRQVLPLGAELAQTPGYCADPVGDLAAMRAPGLLQKYHGRALLVTTAACAVHCRYCFRRHFPYAEGNPARDDWSQVIAHLMRDSTIDEVILSGGDPLSLPDEKLARLASRLAQIPHLRRLRLHTRLPVVIPARVETALLEWLTGTRLRPIVVIHANHPNEIDACVRAALGRLSDAGVTLLNQSVLLRGVNDSIAVLQALSETLFDAAVLPYYLHQMDPVQGAAHFAVEPTVARQLMDQLRAILPGYLVPRLVAERAGQPAKQPL